MEWEARGDFAPRKRGLSVAGLDAAGAANLYPAQAGIIRTSTYSDALQNPLPSASGNDSMFSNAHHESLRVALHK